MPSKSREFQIGRSLLYHVFNRGNAKGQIYHDKSDYECFVNILKNYSRERNLKIYHWVIMPNHYHLLVELENPRNLSSIMAGIGRSYVHYHHRKYDSAGHLFQGRFKSQPVEKESYLLACGRYIERNPVESGLSDFPEEYAFSSSRYYIYGGNDGLTKEDPCFQGFGVTTKGRREEYKSFLRVFDSDEEKLFADLEAPIGSKEFKRRIVKKAGIYIPKRGKPCNI